MKYTRLFLRYTVLVALVLAMLVAFVVAFVLTLASIVGALTESSSQYLLVILVALPAALFGFIILDCLRHLTDKWEI